MVIKRIRIRYHIKSTINCVLIFTVLNHSISDWHITYVLKVLPEIQSNINSSFESLMIYLHLFMLISYMINNMNYLELAVFFVSCWWNWIAACFLNVSPWIMLCLIMIIWKFKCHQFPPPFWSITIFPYSTQSYIHAFTIRVVAKSSETISKHFEGCHSLLSM